MSGSYGLTFEEMQAGAQHILQVNESINGTLSSLRGQLAPLPGMWKGQASTAFVNLMARYDSAAARISEALVAIAEQVQGSSTTYAQEEEAHSQTMSQITSALDS